MHKKHILVTRPVPLAEHTAQKLKTLGLHPIVLPFTRYIPLPQQAFNSVEASAVLITSQAALFYADKHLVESLKNLPLYVVGHQTAKCAQHAGFTNIVMIAPNASRLAQKMALDLPTGTMIYLAGRNRRPILEQHLAANGVTVATIEIYDHQDVPANALRLDKAALPLDGILLYSQKAAQMLDAIEPYINEQTKFYCLSERIAAPLPDTYHSRIYIAETPDENALLRCIFKPDFHL